MLLLSPSLQWRRCLRCVAFLVLLVLPRVCSHSVRLAQHHTVDNLATPLDDHRLRGGHTTEADLFAAVQFLSPLPPSWGPNNPVLDWEGVSPGCNYSVCQRTCRSSVVVLHISQALVGSFTQNRTIRLDLLHSMTELCMLSIDPPAPASRPLQVVVDLMNLPFFVSSIRMPHHELVSVGDAARFGTLPLWLHDLDLSYTGAQGTVMVWVNTPPFNVNLSGNPHLHGGIELWYNDQSSYSTMCNSSESRTAIDLRNTGIERVVVLGSDATCVAVGETVSSSLSLMSLDSTTAGAASELEQSREVAHEFDTTARPVVISDGSSISGSGSDYPGGNTSIWVDEGVVVMTTSLLVQYQIPQGYFCQSFPSVVVNGGGGGGLRLPMLRLMYADSQYGTVVIQALDGGATCETLLVGFQGWATVETGYVFHSTSLAALAPCISNETVFATVRLGNQISFYNATGGTLAVFELCQPSVDSGPWFFSGSVGNTELYALKLNSTSVEGLAMQTTTATLIQCQWDWPLIFESHDNNNMNNESRDVPAYNQGALLEAMRPCLPAPPPSSSLLPRDGTGEGGWVNLTADGNLSNLTLRTASGAVFVFTAENSFLPVMPDVYCYDTLEYSYRWNISSAGSTMSVTSPTNANDTYLTCSYPGIVSYVFSRVNWEAIHDFDDVITPMLPCLSTMGGLVQQWNASESMFSTAGPPTLLNGGSIQLISNAGFSLTFTPSYCSMLLATPTTYCAYVDLYHSTLILQVGANASSMLTYARSSTTVGVLHNLSQCITHAPLVFDDEGSAKFIGFLEMYWDSCMPAYSATDAFDYSLWYVAITPDRSTILLQSPTGANIDLTTTACANMVPPTDLEMCPSLQKASSGSRNDSSGDESSSLAVEDAAGSRSVWCVGSLWCAPYRSVRWHPTTLAADAQRWSTGVHEVSSLVPFGELRAFSGFMSSASVLPATCYPDCTYDVANCTQIAYVSAQLALCASLGGNGLLTSAALIPAIEIGNACANTLAINVTLLLLEQLVTQVAGPSNGPLLSVSCEPGGFAVFHYLRFPVIRSDTAASMNASASTTGTSSVLGGLTAWCTTCESIWLGSLYPTSLLVMTCSALVNLLLVLFSNFVVEPAAGATITKLKVKLFVALGVVLPSKAKSFEGWLLRCRSPLVPTEGELRRHVEAVCAVVLDAAIREDEGRRGGGGGSEDSRTCDHEVTAPPKTTSAATRGSDRASHGALARDEGVGTHVRCHATEKPLEDGDRAFLLGSRVQHVGPSRPVYGTTAASNAHRNSDTSHQPSKLPALPLLEKALLTTDERKPLLHAEYRRACRRFADVYRRRLMRGNRMLRTVDRFGMRRLVQLFDACCRVCASSTNPDRGYHATAQQDRLQLTHFPLLFDEVSTPIVPELQYETVGDVALGSCLREDRQEATQGGASIVATEARGSLLVNNNNMTSSQVRESGNSRASATRRSVSDIPVPLPMSEMHLLGSYQDHTDEASSVAHTGRAVSGVHLSSRAGATTAPAEPIFSFTEVAEAHLEDAIGAVEADTTAFWVPYVLAQEWFNRRFLLPTDWLLFLQLLYVVAMFAVSVDQSLSTIASTQGEKKQRYSSWELYSATYFFFFSSSSCMTLLVNAVVRHAYSLDTTLEVVELVDDEKDEGPSAEVVDGPGSPTSTSASPSTVKAIDEDKRTAAVVAVWFRVLALDPFFTLPVMLCLPALATHILPALVLFPFVPVVGFAAPKLLSRLIPLCVPDVDAETRNLNWYSWRTVLSAVVRVVFQQVCIVTMVALASFSFDYALLFYANERSWTGIISFDFRARSALCAVEQAVDAAGKAWTLIYGQF